MNETETKLQDVIEDWVIETFSDEAQAFIQHELGGEGYVFDSLDEMRKDIESDAETWVEIGAECSNCGGSGGGLYPCRRCNGSGES